MNEHENFIKHHQTLRPYSDNSGHKYKIGIEISSTGAGCVIIEQAGTKVLIDVDDWATVRDAIDDALTFTKDRDAG